MTLQLETLSSLLDLREAAVDTVKGTLTLTVIEAGLNTSETVMYPATVLERDKHVFLNAKMFLNHPSASEEWERPEGDLSNWVAQLKEVWWDRDRKAIRGRATIIDPSFKEKAVLLSQTGELMEMGVSIRAFGEGERKEIAGIKHKVLEVSRLTGAKSVDFVTFPGAGGRVELLESDLWSRLTTELLLEKRPDLVEALQGGGQLDLKDLTAEMLRESRPDLVTELQEAQEGNDLDEMRVQQIKELTESNSSLNQRIQQSTERAVQAEKERDELREKVEKAEKAERQRLVQESLNKALEAVELPAPVVERLRARFEGAESADGIVDAIRAERDYVLKLRAAGVVSDIDILAESDPIRPTDELAGIFKDLGLSESAAKTAAGGRI